MSFFDMHFSLPLAAKAAGVKHDTVSKWIKRGELVMAPKDREKVGRGGGVILSARTTLQLILAAELTRRGLKVADACEAALTFAHEGNIAGQMEAKDVIYDRKPGQLYFKSEGITILSINRERPELSKVLCVSPETPLSRIRHLLDAVDIETLLFTKLGGLGIDVHAAMNEIKS